MAKGSLYDAGKSKERFFNRKFFQGQDFKVKKGLSRQFREFFFGSVGLVEPQNIFFLALPVDMRDTHGQEPIVVSLTGEKTVFSKIFIRSCVQDLVEDVVVPLLRSLVGDSVLLQQVCKGRVDFYNTPFIFVKKKPVKFDRCLVSLIVLSNCRDRF